MAFTDTGIFYASKGDGEALVMLHGVTLDSRMWSDVVDELSKRFRCITVDRRGHGRSAPIQDHASTTRDLLGVLDHAGVERCHLMGLSLGGMDALHFAGIYPERVERQVLVDAWLPAPQMATWRPIREARALGVEAAREAWLADRLFAPIRRNREQAKRLQEIVAANDLSIWFKRVEPAPEPPVLELLPRIEAPTQVIVGELDLPEFQELAFWLQHVIPGAACYPVAVIPDAGHMVPMEQPSAFLAVVNTFLRGIDS
jgi:3-oxoadipate enol-lactonase